MFRYVVRLLVVAKPQWFGLLLEWRPEDGLLSGIEHVAVVDHTLTALDVVEGMAGLGPPGGRPQCITEANPDVQADRAVLKVRDCLLDG